MNAFLSTVFARLASSSARRPGAALLLWALVLAVSLYGISRLTITSSFAAMFGSSSPASQAMHRLAAEYHSSDELLLLVTLPVGAGSDPQPLIDFAARLEAAVRQDVQASAMVADFRYLRDAAYRRYVEEVAAPALPYFLDADAFETFLERLSPDGMRAQLRRAEALIAAPGAAASAIARSVLRDPLRLAELVDQSRFGEGSFDEQFETGPHPELSLDQRTLLVRIAGVEQVDNLGFSRRFVEHIFELATRVNADALTLEAAGGYAIAATTSRGIKRDSIQSVIAAVILLQVVFLIIYRRPIAPFLIGSVAAAGIIVGFGARSGFETQITPLTAVISAMLAGLGIDYGIHFFSHYQAHRADDTPTVDASRATAAAIGVPISATCITTMFGFLSLLLSSVRMLRDFAVLGVLGLTGCLASAMLLLPALLALRDRAVREPTQPPRLSALARRALAHRRACLVAGLVLLFVSVFPLIFGSGLPTFETDVSILHPRPNSALELTNALPRRFGLAPETIPVEIRAESQAAMTQAAHDAAALLASPRARSIGITNVFGLDSLVPDPRSMSSRQDRLRQLGAERALAEFDSAVAESAFAADAFAGYRDLLREMVASAPPQARGLYDYPSIARQLLPHPEAPRADDPLGTLLIVALSRPLTNRDERDEVVHGIRDLLADVPQAALTGMSAVASDLERATRRGFPQSATLALLLVVAWLLLALRRPFDVTLALVPLVFATLCTLGLMSWFGVRLNAVNGVALPLLFGIAVDAGVFVVFAAQPRDGEAGNLTARLGSTTQAVLTASATTVAGFAALCFTSTPAIRSLGILASFGVSASFAGVVLVLLPVIGYRDSAARGSNA